MANQSEANLPPHLDRFWMYCTTHMHFFFIKSIHRKPSVTCSAIPHTEFHLQCKIWDKFFVRYSYPLEKLRNTLEINWQHRALEHTKWQITLELNVSIEDSGANLASKRFLPISLSGLFEWLILCTFLTECRRKSSRENNINFTFCEWYFSVNEYRKRTGEGVGCNRDSI